MKKTSLSIDLVKTPDDGTKTIKPTSFLAGDLAFLAIMMGKDNFSSSWCCWCDPHKAKWQGPQTAVKAEDLWYILKIQAQAK